jgi:hypothetical protein
MAISKSGESFRTGFTRGDYAGFAIGRPDNSTCNRSLSIFFPVELARPLIVRRPTVLIGAVHGDFHAVTHGFIDNGVVLRHPRDELGFLHIDAFYGSSVVAFLGCPQLGRNSEKD